MVTNYHVIDGASELRVTLQDQAVYPATVVGFDEDKDIAVLQVRLRSRTSGTSFWLKAQTPLYNSHMSIILNPALHTTATAGGL